MRKKLFVLFFVCVLSLSSLFANLDYQFDLFSLDPLHKEYFADRARADMSINYLNYFEGVPNKILQDVRVNAEDHDHEVKVWKLRNDLSNGTMMQVKLGETISVARNTISFDNFLSPISFDLSIQALIQSFYTEEFNNGIGYDGIYFYGGTFRIGDVLSLRIGNHHYCSHYGDEVFNLIDKDTTVNSPFNQFNMGYKYIRMNTKVFGISLDLTPSFRIYGEYNIPPKDVYAVRPYMFSPNWIKLNGVAINDYPDSYKARIINVGFEFSTLIFKKLGKTTLGYDLHMYEEGKIIYDHENGGIVTFDEDAPWELEHNVVIAQNINDTTSIELEYHNGRSPFNNFYFLHTSYIGISLRFNPFNTLTAFSTKK